MEIVVNDTNILIDLCNTGLLQYCKNLDVAFRTVDLVINEITVDKQKTAVQGIIDSGILTVCQLSGEQLLTVFEKMNQFDGICNLSVVDVSVMIYAKENNCKLLTGDKTLRNRAILENVDVSGILFLTDMMTEQGIVPKQIMIDAYSKLLESNTRTPRKLIQQRIDELKSEL